METILFALTSLKFEFLKTILFIFNSASRWLRNLIFLEHNISRNLLKTILFTFVAKKKFVAKNFHGKNFFAKFFLKTILFAFNSTCRSAKNLIFFWKQYYSLKWPKNLIFLKTILFVSNTNCGLEFFIFNSASRWPRNLIFFHGKIFVAKKFSWQKIFTKFNCRIFFATSRVRWIVLFSKKNKFLSR